MPNTLNIPHTMKITPLITAFFCTFANGQEEPTDYLRLQELRLEKIDDINQQYLKALERLRTKYTKKGNLEVAVMIDNEIKSFEALVKKSKSITEQSENQKAILGKWFLRAKGNSRLYWLTFSKDGKVIKAREGASWSGEYKMKGTTVTAYIGEAVKTFEFTKTRVILGKGKDGKEIRISLAQIPEDSSHPCTPKPSVYAPLTPTTELTPQRKPPNTKKTERSRQAPIITGPLNFPLPLKPFLLREKQGFKNLPTSTMTANIQSLLRAPSWSLKAMKLITATAAAMTINTVCIAK